MESHQIILFLKTQKLINSPGLISLGCAVFYIPIHFPHKEQGKKFILLGEKGPQSVEKDTRKKRTWSSFFGSSLQANQSGNLTLKWAPLTMGEAKKSHTTSEFLLFVPYFLLGVCPEVSFLPDKNYVQLSPFNFPIYTVFHNSFLLEPRFIIDKAISGQTRGARFPKRTSSGVPELGILPSSGHPRVKDVLNRKAGMPNF